MAFYDNFFDDTHKSVREVCKRFAEKEIAPHALAWEEAGGFPRGLAKKAAGAGVLGLGFPEEVGGAGGSMMHQVMGIEGMMYGLSTGVSVGLGSVGIALPALVQSENKDLIDRYVRPALAGDKLCSLAVTEPGTGSDVASIRTSARREDDHYVINGSKLFITTGTKADFFTTLVRTGGEGHGGLSFIVIEANNAGVTVSQPLKKTGWWGSDTAELFFEDVRVPVENLVGAENSGFLTVMRNFQTERVALAAYGAITAQLALDHALKYTKEREAFGRPIGKFQVTKHKLADMATKTMAARTMVYQVASRLDAGEYLVAEVAMAKNFCAETAVSVTYDAVQIFGGMGYMRETVVERLSRDARLLPIGGGTQEIMKEIIAKMLF